ncbi:MAG: ABC transporter substrate-binding protein [Clostridia bacterium]|nr:ABC transporter substrate-binding protein [Clostridia bacterium]
MKNLKKIIAVSLAAVTVLSLTACGDSKNNKSNKSKEYTIGICQLVEHEALDAATKGFKDAIIKELGEDKVKFEEKNAQGESATCATIVNSFVSENVDLILANATASLQAAANATSDIPVLGTSITDYATALALKDFDGVIGNNISGTCDLAPIDDQAKMIMELFPKAKNVGLLYCSAEPNSKYQIDLMKKYLEEKDIKCKEYSFVDSNDISAVVTKAADKSDVIYIPTDNTAANNTEVIDNIARPKKVPIVAGEQGICKGCGVATLSISYYDLGYTTGEMAVDILKNGKDITKMEIKYAPEVTKQYNKEIAKKLDIEIPEGYEEIGE